MATPNLSFKPYLHGFPGVAALAVLLFHLHRISPFPGALNHFYNKFWQAKAEKQVSSFGWCSILLFFVFPVYILGGHLLRTRQTLNRCQRFWFRRFCRIYPAIWLQPAALLLLITLGIKGLKPPVSWLDGVLNFSLPTTPPDLPRAINSSWWTLPIGPIFYPVLPALAVISAYFPEWRPSVSGGARTGYYWGRRGGWRLSVIMLSKNPPCSGGEKDWKKHDQ